MNALGVEQDGNGLPGRSDMKWRSTEKKRQRKGSGVKSGGREIAPMTR